MLCNPTRCLDERETRDGELSPVPVPAGTRGIHALQLGPGLFLLLFQALDLFFKNR